MSDLRYFDLRIPAPKRLAMMRDAFRGHAARYPHCPESIKPADWRRIRGYTLGSYAAAFGLASSGRNGKTPVIYSFDADSLPGRGIQFADEIPDSPVNHGGWYADTICSGKIRGIVVALPHGRFLSGYHHSDTDEHVLFCAETFDDIREAARNADSEAERHAETCRDDSERFDAMQKAESDKDDAKLELLDCIALCRAGRRARDDVAEAWETMHEKRGEYRDACRAYEGLTK